MRTVISLVMIAAIYITGMMLICSAPRPAHASTHQHQWVVYKVRIKPGNWDTHSFCGDAITTEVVCTECGVHKEIK